MAPRTPESTDAPASEALPELRVRRDADLQRDLDEARRKTGIRTDSELVRHAVRQLAGRAAF